MKGDEIHRASNIHINEQLPENEAFWTGLIKLHDYLCPDNNRVEASVADF